MKSETSSPILSLVLFCLVWACLCWPTFASAGASAEGKADPGERLETVSHHFCKYRPSYMVLGAAENGGGNPTTKFQFSFRYSFVDFGADDPTGEGSEDHCTNPPRHLIRFGYTQKSIWRLYDYSAPFEENNYNPEIYYSYAIRKGPLDVLSFGIDHESNGLGDPDSRAWNRVFAQARFSWKFAENWPPGWQSQSSRANHLWEAQLYARVWASDEWNAADQRGIVESRGYFNLIGVLATPDFRRFGSAEFEIEFTKGGHPFQFDRAGVLLGISYHTPLGKNRRFVPHFYSQYFDGFAETLSRTDRHVRAFRTGLRFIR